MSSKSTSEYILVLMMSKMSKIRKGTHIHDDLLEFKDENDEDESK